MVIERMLEEVQPGALDLPQSPVYEKASHIRVLVVHLVAADTEYSWQVPAGVKWIKLHSRDGTAIRMATERGVVAVPSANNYFTIISADVDAYAGGEVEMSNLDIHDPDMFLYFASGTANKFVEIIVGI